MTHGIAGFGANSQLHTATILRLSADLPVVLTWIDAPARVERLLPGLIELAGSGIVTVEDVRVASYGGRRVEQFRFDLSVARRDDRRRRDGHPDDDGPRGRRATRRAGLPRPARHRRRRAARGYGHQP